MVQRIGFVGAGAVGSTLARALSATGVEVAAVTARRPERAAALADEIPGCSHQPTAQAVVAISDLIFLTVPDDAIELVCDSVRWSEGKAAVHCCGAHTVDVLASAARQGAATGTCHPMQAFAGSGDVAEHLNGCMFGIEAEEPLRNVIADLVRRVGGWPLFVDGKHKASYHMAGVMASNYFVALTAAATNLLESLGLSPEDSLRALLPILSGTLRNLESRGLPMALTGPISRGDSGTIQLHLRTLAERHPELLATYVAMGRQTIPVARARGGLSPEAEHQIVALFDHYGRK